MKKQTVYSLALSVMLAGSSMLAGCQKGPTDPMYSLPQQQSRIMGDDPFISQARIALASYKEADASFSDSQRLASQRYATQDLGSTLTGSLSGNGSVSVGDGGVSAGTSTSVGASGSTASSTSGNASGSASGSASASADASASASTGSGVSTSVGTSGDAGVSTSLGNGGNSSLGVTTRVGANASAADANDIDLGLGSHLSGSLNPNLDGGAALNNANQISSAIRAMLDTNLDSIGSLDASLGLFNHAAGQFGADLLKSGGVELGSNGMVTINVNDLDARIKSDLQGDAQLANPSLDLNGQLKAGTHGNLPLFALSPLGYSATGSDALLQTHADGSSSESLLLKFQNLDADLSNQVRVVSEIRGSQTDALNLRLDSQAHAFTRTGLREIKAAANGNTQIDTQLSMKLDNGTVLDLTEKRFATATGAGSGFGSFSITTGSGQHFNGTLRSAVAADGSLMLLLQPSDSSLGNLMFQEKANGKANLALYNSQGKLDGSSEIDLAAAVDAMANG